jgi:hypothetical protein
VTNDVIENELEAAIRATLLASSDLAAAIPGFGTAHIWNGAAEEGTDCPFVVFMDMSPQPGAVAGGGGGNHRYNFGDRRVLTEHTFLVKGVTEGLATMEAGTIDRAIDRALHGAELSVAPYTCLICRRSQDVSYPETDKGRSFRHRGGLYTIQLTS